MQFSFIRGADKRVSKKMARRTALRVNWCDSEFKMLEEVTVYIPPSLFKAACYSYSLALRLEAACLFSSGMPVEFHRTTKHYTNEVIAFKKIMKLLSVKSSPNPCYSVLPSNILISIIFPNI
jgi:hypothetical protein